MRSPLLLCLASFLPSFVIAEEPARQTRRLTLTVSEEAGSRRFGYPVSQALPGKRFHKDDRFRLLENGKPVAAQFRLVRPAKDGQEALLFLDFNSSVGPLEERTYTLEYGPDVEPMPEPRGGMKVEMGPETIAVKHLPGMDFEVPRNLVGLLRQVRVGKTEYLRPDSSGLSIRHKNEANFRAVAWGPDGMPAATVAREGPLATGLRFEGTEAPRDGHAVASRVSMEFPRSKSWVRIAWVVDDPRGDVAGLRAGLNLNLQGNPTLVDFGAGTSVYAALPRGQSALLRSRWLEDRGTERLTTWETLVGQAGALQPFVVAPKGNRSRAEGWAHVMDRDRCTAVAVEHFASAQADGSAAAVAEEIQVDADGRLQVERGFARKGEAPPPGPKGLVFFLHFVSMPVQVGAKTSPQAMLAPLTVQVKE